MRRPSRFVVDVMESLNHKVGKKVMEKRVLMMTISAEFDHIQVNDIRW